MKKKNIFKVIKTIQKESKNAERYNTGLLGEQMIVASYKSMTLDKLEKLRFIMNQIIKKKKEMKRVENAKSNDINSTTNMDSNKEFN